LEPQSLSDGLAGTALSIAVWARAYQYLGDGGDSGGFPVLYFGGFDPYGSESIVMALPESSFESVFVRPGTWYHVVYTFDSTAFTGYANGQLLGTIGSSESYYQQTI
jgi:hypothetical protein